MSLYRKKPVVVEAFQINNREQMDEISFAQDWPQWGQDAWLKQFDEPGSIYPLAGALCICTLEGSLVISNGDWIIQGVHGEIYPCKPDIFAATYEAASSTPKEKA